MSEFPQVFDDVFVSLISVGEESGELPDVMLKLTESLKWQDELIAKAKTVIIYPAFVGVVVLGSHAVHDAVCRAADGGFHTGNGSGPANSHAGADRVIQLSRPTTGGGQCRMPVRHPVGNQDGRRAGTIRFRMIVDGWKLRFWYIGPVMSKIVLSRFASYFALCYGAGLDVLSSLKISENIAGNAVIRKGIQDISAGIADGTVAECTASRRPICFRRW